ncbi:MAG: amidophosphoribosyltransferase [Oligoflexales bacterium]
MLDEETWNEECGVVGIIGSKDAAQALYLGLYALQHRGQEAFGITTFEDKETYIEPRDHKALGTVSDSVQEEALQSLQGDLGIGHVRYSTQGGQLVQNIQPFIFRTPHHGPVAIAHNGNLTNAAILRKSLEESGSIFTTTTDSEVFIHLLAKSRKSRLRERISEVMEQVRGAYALTIIAKDRLYGIRDPFGFRPLVLGKKGPAWMLASETCALDLVGAAFVREVEPGEVIRLSRAGIESFYPLPKPETKASCAFEPIYFSRPDSRISNQSIYELRKRMGEVLAEESPVEADLVLAVPDSGVPMAIGYSQNSGIPMELGLVRNHYVGRTFIDPYQSKRDFGVKLKLNPVKSVLRDKRIIVIDDSVVRGTTCVKIVQMLRNAGAKEIHFRVGSPPITHSCYYGVSTPDRKKLLAAQKTLKEICEMLDADTMAYLSVEGLKKALHPSNSNDYCYACFTGRYPEKIFCDIPEQPTDSVNFV